MREIILSYWDSFFTDLIRPYRDEITAISMLIVAIFTVVLARVAWKQTRDARILQRANLDAKFGGVRDTPRANWWVVSISKTSDICQHKNCVGWSGWIAAV
jgi:hypothetical protein